MFTSFGFSHSRWRCGFSALHSGRQQQPGTRSPSSGKRCRISSSSEKVNWRSRSQVRGSPVKQRRGLSAQTRDKLDPAANGIDSSYSAYLHLLPLSFPASNLCPSPENRHRQQTEGSLLGYLDASSFRKIYHSHAAGLETLQCPQYTPSLSFHPVIFQFPILCSISETKEQRD